MKQLKHLFLQILILHKYYIILKKTNIFVNNFKPCHLTLQPSGKLVWVSFWPRTGELVSVFNAMISHPYNVAGKGHFDTKFITALNGNAVTKGGGESIRGIALKNRDGKNFGISLKVLDGSPRAMPTGVFTLLEHLDLLTKEELSNLKEFKTRERKNCRDKKIGQVEVYIES